MEHKLNYNDLWAYAPAPEDSGHVNIRDRYGLFLNGRFQDADSGKTFEKIGRAHV